MNFSPAQWVLIDCGSQYGLDKEPYEVRLGFGRNILEELQNETDVSDWIAQADEPEMFIKSLIAIQDILDGKPTGHMIGLDASNSGPALLSILGRCETGMNNTCLGDTPSDLYSKIDMKGYTRTQVKKATIPYVYGSNKAPENVFGEDAPIFEEAYEKAVPVASAIRDILLAAWNSSAETYTWLLPDGHTAHIKVGIVKDIPMSFMGESYIQRTTVNGAKKKGMSLPANVTHSWDGFVIRELTRRCNWKGIEEGIAAIKHHLKHGSKFEPDDSLEDLTYEFEFLSVYGFDYIKRDHMRGMSEVYLNALLNLGMYLIKYPPFNIRSIHDECACHPNHVNKMQEMYNLIMAESYDSTWLESILHLLTGTDFSSLLSKPKSEVVIQLMNAKYAFH